MAVKDQQQFCMRPMAVDDLETVSQWFQHLADLCLFDRGSPIPVNREITEESWKDVLTGTAPRRGYWFALDNEVGDVMGIAGIENINYANGDGVLAIYLAEQARRKGLAAKASCNLLDLAFDQLRLHRITTYYRDDNEITKRLITMLGFAQEGVMREAWFAGGKHFDVIAVGILQNEWVKARKKITAELDGSVRLQFGSPPWQAKVWPENLT